MKALFTPLAAAALLCAGNALAQYRNRLVSITGLDQLLCLTANRIARRPRDHTRLQFFLQAGG